MFSRFTNSPRESFFIALGGLLTAVVGVTLAVVGFLLGIAGLFARPRFAAVAGIVLSAWVPITLAMWLTRLRLGRRQGTGSAVIFRRAERA